MNRIQSYLSDIFGSDVANTVEVEVAAGRFHSAPAGASHSLFVPLHYEQNYAYPMIVWLHGANDDERQLKRIMPFVSMRNYVAVAPRGIVHAAADDGAGDNAASDGPGQVGCSWNQTEDHILLAEHRVLEAVAAASRQLNIAPQRIFLAGFGCGGTMAFRLALNMPQIFAGALSLNGPFPSGLMPLAQLHRVRRLKFLLASGRDSGRYPPEKVCENLRLLYAAGMSISLRQYPCGDDLTTHMLSDMDRWIMEQIATPVTADEGSAQPRAGGSAE
jgi:phospholipase/carboxylesterase